MRRRARIGQLAVGVALASLGVLSACGGAPGSGDQTQGSGRPHPATAVTDPADTSSPTITPVLASTPTVTLGEWTGREPASIYFSGDAGDIATGLVWTIWNQTEAVGHGTRDVLGCVPNCAQGTATPYPVTITLTKPVSGQFTSLVELTAKGNGLTETFAAPDLAQGACTTSNEHSCGFAH